MDEISLKNFVRVFIWKAYEIDNVLSAKEVFEHIYSNFGCIWINANLEDGFLYLVMQVVEFMHLQRYLSLLNETKKEHPANWKYRLIKKELI